MTDFQLFPNIGRDDFFIIRLFRRIKKISGHEIFIYNCSPRSIEYLDEQETAVYVRIFAKMPGLHFI